jgi:hypothetical protein
MNTALLVLRLVPGMLLIGHGLQKLGPAKCSPPLLHAVGHKAIATASSNSIFGEGSPLRCSLGRLRSLGASRSPRDFHSGRDHPDRGGYDDGDPDGARAPRDWSAEGGFEFPLVLMVVVFVITALGAGSYSINAWAHVNNWAGIHNWPMSDVARAGISLAVGVVGGLLTVIASRLAARSRADTSIPTTG